MALYEPALSPTRTVALAKFDSYTHIVGWKIPTAVDNAVVKGDKMFIDTILTDGPDWMTSNPIAWAEVYLRVYNPDGSLYFEDWDLTGASGSVSFSGVPLPTMTGTCTVVVSFAGDATYNPSEASIEFVTEARVPVLSLTMPTEAMPGSSITWSGDIFDPRLPTLPLAGRDIFLDESVDGVNWAQVAGPIVTDSAGAYSGTYTLPSEPGVYYYRARFPGDLSLYEGAVSGSARIPLGIPPVPLWKVALVVASIFGAAGAGVYFTGGKS